MIVSEAYEAEEKNKLPARPAEGTLALVLVMVELLIVVCFDSKGVRYADARGFGTGIYMNKWGYYRDGQERNLFHSCTSCC